MPSRVHEGGVGVFAIRDIKKGTYIFEPDDDDMTWVEVSEVATTPQEVQRLYQDFCVKRNGHYGCPENFNRLTISWYLNHSDEPNVDCDDDYKFFARRDIKCGEELTANYRGYSDADLVTGFPRH